jgi:hypothetical protein
MIGPPVVSQCANALPARRTEIPAAKIPDAATVPIAHFVLIPSSSFHFSDFFGPTLELSGFMERRFWRGTKSAAAIC